MCVVSAVLDYGKRQWPLGDDPYAWPNRPQPRVVPMTPAIPMPSTGPTPDEWAAFRELLRKAADFDKTAKQPECEDPAKVEWMRAMEARIAALEQKGDGGSAV